MGKDELVKLLMLALAITISSIYARAQVDSGSYDMYSPLQYSPLCYKPLPTGSTIEHIFHQTEFKSGQLIINKYQLSHFLSLSKKYPELTNDYRGSLADYARMDSKSNETDKLWKRREMRHFQYDWDLLHRHDAQKRREKLLAERKRLVNDSIAARVRFVSDSLTARQSFLNDSINFRHHFVQDSLYRDEYRKTHNYDNVVFDGPHGKPLQCYRGGKMIDGEIRNGNVLVEKWANGQRIYKRIQFAEYFDAYLQACEHVKDPLPYEPNEKVISCYLRSYPVAQGVPKKIPKPSLDSDILVSGYYRYLRTIHEPLCKEAASQEISKLLEANKIIYTSIDREVITFSFYSSGYALAFKDDEGRILALAFKDDLEKKWEKKPSYIVRVFPKGLKSTRIFSAPPDCNYKEFVLWGDNPQWAIYASESTYDGESMTRYYYPNGKIREESIFNHQKHTYMHRKYDSNGELIFQR